VKSPCCWRSFGPCDAAHRDVDAARLHTAEHSVEVRELRLELEVELLGDRAEDVAVEADELTAAQRGVRHVGLDGDLHDARLDGVVALRRRAAAAPRGIAGPTAGEHHGGDRGERREARASTTASVGWLAHRSLPPQLIYHQTY
jgi:hypothetical protein